MDFQVLAALERREAPPAPPAQGSPAAVTLTWPATLSRLQAVLRSGFAPDEFTLLLTSCLQAQAETPYALEPCLALATLCYAAQARLAAVQFCREALRLDAANADARRLLALSDALPPAGPRLFLLDDEALYERIGRWLGQSLKYFARPAPAEAQARLLGQIEADLGQIRGLLALLEQDLDTSALQHQLQPLEALCRRLSGQLAIADELGAIKDLILTERRWLNQQLKAGRAASEDHDRNEDALEDLLDRCDAVADRLDALDTRGASLVSVKPFYDAWLLEIDAYQELLDAQTA